MEPSHWIKDAAYLENIGLYHSDAVYRDQHISEVEYDVKLMLSDKMHFVGDITIKFKLKQRPRTPLHLDFRGEAISQINVNGA